MVRRPSTRNLSALPTAARVEEISRSLALLDAIMEPEWDFRVHSFDPPASQEVPAALATMRDGVGNFYYMLFLDGGAVVIRGFDHDSIMSPFRRPDETPWPGLFDGMPAELVPFRNAAVVMPEEVTFVLWHESTRGWQIGRVSFPPGSDPDGSERLLAFLDDDPKTYVKHAKEVWERDIPLDAVRAVYRHAPITASLVHRINPEADVDTSLATAQSLGFDVKGTMKDKRSKAVSIPAAHSTSSSQPAKRKVNMGHASFTIEAKGDRIQMLIDDGVVVESTVDDQKFYERLFMDVKARIAAAKGDGG